MPAVLHPVRVLVLVLLPGVATELSGQAIRVQTFDAETRAAVPSAIVEVLVQGEAEDRLVARGTTDRTGETTLYLVRGGTYALRVTRIGYGDVAARTFDVDSRELVEVRLPMSIAPVILDAIAVEGRRADPRLEPTHEGLYARRASTSSLGPERVVVRSDPEMANVTKVSDVLRWFPRPRDCFFYYVDGRPVDRKYWTADDFFMSYPVSHLEGIEYYRADYMIPLGFSPPQRELLEGGTCTAVMIWTRRAGM